MDEAEGGGVIAAPRAYRVIGARPGLGASRWGRVLGALILTAVTLRTPATDAISAAILIAGAAVLILWTSDEPLPSARKSATSVGTRYHKALAGTARPGTVPSGIAPPGIAPSDTAPSDTAPPTRADRAKYLGLIKVAYNLPLVVGPLIAGVVLSLMSSHRAVFAVAGVVTLAPAATVTRARLTS